MKKAIPLLACLLAACASPEERCNAARVVAHDRLTAYADSLRAAPRVDLSTVTTEEYARIDANCRAATGTTVPDAPMSPAQAAALIGCRGDAMNAAAGAWPSEAAVRRLSQRTLGSTIEFRDALAAFRTSQGPLLPNGPDATEALAASDGLVEACIHVFP